ncbi:MAG: PAS domain S-box protein [Ignavibacteriales bacterium]|nr:PAS domain S-box protein [Ignavibacteriales bacterium]
MNDDAYSDAAMVRALLVNMELPVDLSYKKPEGSIPYKIVAHKVPIQDVISKAALEQYDIAIIELDIENPDTAIAAISELQNTHHLPVVVISQICNNTILRQIQFFPSVVLLFSPFSPAEYHDALQQVLQKRTSLSPSSLRTPSALSLAESRYQLLFQSSIDGFMLIDLNGKILDVNDAYLAVTGYTAEEVYQLGLIELEAIDTPEDIYLRIKKIVANGFDRFESRHKCSDGTLVDFEIKIVYKANEEHLLCFFNTITERKRIEQTQLSLLHGSFLRKNESYFQSLARFIAESLGFDYICIDILQGNLLQANTIAVYFDGNFEDNVQYTLHDTPCGKVVGNTVCCFPRNVRHLFPNDTILQDMAAESYIGATLWNSSGSPIGLIAAIGRKPIKNLELNETLLKLIAIRAAGELERELAETELRQSEAQYRRLIESMQEGLLEVDNDDVIVFANPKFCSNSVRCLVIKRKNCSVK